MEINDETSAEAEKYHTKPNRSGPCEVCGTTQKNLKARHRQNKDGSYQKLVKVAFGQDTSEVAIHGRESKNGNQNRR